MTRWIVVATTAAVVAMTFPGAADAAVGERAHGAEGGAKMTSAAHLEGGERSGTIADWLLEAVSAFWGEVRSVIVPGDENHGTGSAPVASDPVSKGS